MNSRTESGFVWTVEARDRHGIVTDREVIHNLQPIEGLNHMMGVTFKSTVQVATWYIGLYEGNYTPTPDITAATISGLATECVAYTPAQRVEFNEGAVATGAVDNSANKAIFTFTSPKTIYGGFIISSSVRNGTAGVIISAVRFTSPKVLDTDGTLSVTAGNALVSA
jgi:hypothetical protein